MLGERTNIFQIVGDGVTDYIGRLAWLISRIPDLVIDIVYVRYLFCRTNGNEIANIRDDLFYDLLDQYVRKPAPSPPRLATDIFLYHYLSIHKSKFVGKEIVEFGCGDGAYSKLFHKLIQDTSYYGLDINPRKKWGDLESEKTRFDYFDADDLMTYAAVDKDKSIICFTHSALEHFPNDLKFIKNIHDMCLVDFGLNIVPSRLSSLLYLNHGYRTYSKRTLNKLANEINADSFEIFKIGGWAIFFVMAIYITIPRMLRLGDLRERYSKGYMSALRIAMKYDKLLARFSPAIFYCLIVQPNSNK